MDMGHVTPESLVDEAVTLAEQWLAATEAEQSDAERATSQQLAGLVCDPEGLDLAVRFVDRVARPEDNRVAARELANLAGFDASGFLSFTDRILFAVGARVAPLMPGIAVPAARARLRQLVGHLVVDAHDPQLAQHLAAAREQGFRLNINLLGEMVLGEEEAASRAARTVALLERDDVDYVSIKVSSLVSQISTWDTPGTVERVLERLRPIYRAAARSPRAFVNMDMEEYKDLDVTIEVFTALLSDPEFRDLEAGIVLQAYVPDSVPALDRLIDFARDRVASGGAPIKIRFVKGANLSMEKVEAEVHGWHQAPYATKAEVDANYLRVVDRALRPENAGALRIGVASHNLYDVALAHLLAERRGVAHMMDVEMLQGMAPSQARAVRDTVGSVILYTPVVAPEDFDVAVSYLVRRLEENSQPENFLHSLFAETVAMPQQEAWFRASVAAMDATVDTPRRTPERAPAGATFDNAIDSDPSIEEVRAWATEHVRATPAPLTSPVLRTAEDVDGVIATGLAAQPAWAARPPAERAAILRRAADELEARRGELLTRTAAEGGKSVGESDPEITEAVDFARYYADRAEELDPAAGHLSTDGAAVTPGRLTLVTPPWNFPVAIPIGGVLAALAVGSAVVIKPAGAVPGCTETAVEALHAAGVPDDVVQVVRTDGRATGRRLVEHPDVDTVILTGSAETGELFTSWRHGRPGGPRVFGETSGKNALVITPAADYDLAVADLVRSAFGHAGQKCSAASLAILVGSAGTSERLRRQLIDAVTSVRVAWPQDLGAVMGPVITPPEGKLHRALTSLEEGESWLVEPRPLDDSGRLWSPGLKDGVRPGSFFHRTEVFGPVLGIMRSDTLDEALELQNAVDFGLTGGLHSLDEAEIDTWLENVEVGNAYVNRHITGAIVRRQSFGGWKGSVLGPGAKAGGPNYVAQLGTWTETALPTRTAAPTADVAEALANYLALADDADRAWLRAAVGSDAAALEAELGQEVDDSGLRAEANVFRYRPAPLTVRTVAGARPAHLLRVLLAAQAAGTPVRVSLDHATSAALKALDGPATHDALRRLASHVDVGETTQEFLARAADLERIRVVGEGPEAAAIADALHGPGHTVLTGPVLANGRREMLSVLREQAISHTLHRFGHLPAGV